MEFEYSVKFHIECQSFILFIHSQCPLSNLGHTPCNVYWEICENIPVPHKLSLDESPINLSNLCRTVSSLAPLKQNIRCMTIYECTMNNKNAICKSFI